MIISHICSAIRCKEWVEDSKRKKKNPSFKVPWFIISFSSIISEFNSLEEPQSGLLNSSNISKVWVEHFNFLFPNDSVDNNPVPPLVLRNPHTTEMSRLDKIFRHDVPIRNQLIRVTAPVEFTIQKNHRVKEKIIFTGVWRARKS